MIALVLSIVAAHSTTFARIPDLNELAERSRSVVSGVVEASTTATTPYGLATRYTVRVDERLRGLETDTITVELPGGHVDGLTQRFASVPIWEVGETVVVFVPMAGPQPLTGVFTTRGDTLLDPIGRPDSVPTLTTLRARLADLPPPVSPK